MFISVERDDVIIDYDMYVRRLRDDLKEALVLAQKNDELSDARQTYTTRGPKVAVLKLGTKSYCLTKVNVVAGIWQICESPLHIQLLP